MSTAKAQADFALNLLRNSGSFNTSLIYSPFSLTVALAAAYVGAEGKTRAQIKNALAAGIEEEDFKKYLFEELESILQIHDDYVLKLGNRLYVDKTFSILESYILDLKTKLTSEIKTANFKEPDAVAKEVNDWIDNITNSKIKELLKSDDVVGSSLIIANAVYFNGEWLLHFDPTETKLETFYSSENEHRQVDMMHSKKNIEYIDNNEVQILRLPYKSPKITMTIFLPKEKFGLEKWVKNLTGEHLLRMMQDFGLYEVTIAVPKFKLDLMLELPEVLTSLGIVDAFSKTDANFSGISETPLYISGAFHKAFIDVNERGTEVAGATGFVPIPMCIMEPATFIADHPFLFVIAKENTLLFVGRYV